MHCWCIYLSDHRFRKTPSVTLLGFKADKPPTSAWSAELLGRSQLGRAGHPGSPYSSCPCESPTKKVSKIYYIFCFQYCRENIVESRLQSYSAKKAIGLIAEVALELIDIILVDAPPSTVGGLTVEAVLGAALCDVQTQL